MEGDKIPYTRGLEYFKGKETEFIIDSFCPKNRVVLLLGREGCGKSKFALGMAHSVTTGNPFLSLEVQQGNVLWYNLDNVFPSDIKERCEELGRDDISWVEDVIWYDGDMNIVEYDKEKEIEPYNEIINIANKEKVKLIIFDTLTCLFVSAGVNENAPLETKQVTKHLRTIATKTEACVLALHHMPKDIENISGRGSTAIAADVDQEFYFTPKSKMLDTVTIEVKKARTHRIQIFPIELNQDGYHLNSLENTGEPLGAWRGLINQTPANTQFINDVEAFEQIMRLCPKDVDRPEIEAHAIDHKTLMKMLPWQNKKTRIGKVLRYFINNGRLIKEKHGNNPNYSMKV